MSTQPGPANPAISLSTAPEPYVDVKRAASYLSVAVNLLRQNNNNPKVVQGLLRHASYSITMNVYDEAMSEEKRNAHRG
jgi:hypothetical protein